MTECVSEENEVSNLFEPPQRYVLAFDKDGLSSVSSVLLLESSEFVGHDKR